MKTFLTAFRGAGIVPPIFFGCAKENGPCTVQKKPLSLNGGAIEGMRWRS